MMLYCISGSLAGLRTKNIEKVLNRLSNKKCRKAVFKTVICLVFSNEKYFFEGKVYGSISSKRMGKQGFGYDPIFIPSGLNKTFSQMSMDEKNKIIIIFNRNLIIIYNLYFFGSFLHCEPCFHKILLL